MVSMTTVQGLTKPLLQIKTCMWYVNEKTIRPAFVIARENLIAYSDFVTVELSLFKHFKQGFFLGHRYGCN